MLVLLVYTAAGVVFCGISGLMLGYALAIFFLPPTNDPIFAIGLRYAASGVA